jgi:hypothetical protein
MIGSLIGAVAIFFFGPDIASTYARKVSNIRLSQAATPTMGIVLGVPMATCASGKPSVALSWQAGPDTSGFSVQRRLSSDRTWKPQAQVGSATTFVDTNVQAGTLYRYHITASVGPRFGRSSNVRSVTVPMCETVATTTPPVTIPPKDPGTGTTTPPAATTTPVVDPVVPKPVATTTASTTPPVATTTPSGANATSTSSSTPPSSTQPPKPVATTTATSSPTTAYPYQWGAYAGWRIADITDFETRVVKNFSFLATFVHWGNNKTFPVHLVPFAKDKGRTLVIFWEATDYNVASVNQPLYSYDAVLNGTWDAYIAEFAESVKNYGGPVILIPYSEMNGNWFPWSGTQNGNTPAKAIAAYRYIHGFFGNVPNVKFGWAPNSNSVPDTAENAHEKYYPGDAYVDYVGIDGFNFGSPWVTFDQVFGNALTRLSVYKKPMYIFSMASADGPLKAAWMEDAFQTQMKKYPLVKGWIWFNENKERDWRLWSDEQSFAVFKKVIGL